MWVWIVIGVVALAVAVWAFWPRRGRLDDGAVLSRRRGAQGENERSINSNQYQWHV